MHVKKLLGVTGLAVLLAGVAWVLGPGTLRDDESRGIEAQGIATPAWADPPIPNCPALFAVCNDVFGRNCNFSSMCTTTNTGEKKCKKPDGSQFICPGQQTIRVQNCPCRDVFHMTCCEDESCGQPCPPCESQPGSQTYFCL